MIIELVFPTTDDERVVWAYRQEHIGHSEGDAHGSGGLLEADNYQAWLKSIEDLHYGPVPVGHVKSTTYLALLDERVIGMVQVRHALNEDLQGHGGHVVCGIRPTERRKGYGTKLLDLALDACSDVETDEILMTCSKDDIAAAKIISRNFGRLVEEVTGSDGAVIQHYRTRVCHYKDNEPPEVAHLPRRYIYVISDADVS